MEKKAKLISYNFKIREDEIMATKKTRRTFSPEEKARIVLEMLDGGRKPSEIAEEYNIHPSLLHEWKKEFLENAAAVFVRRRPDIMEESTGKTH